MIKRQATIFAAALTFVSACSTSEPGNRPSIFGAPSATTGNGIGNLFAGARRKRVSSFVRQNYANLVLDFNAGDVGLPYAGMDIANVPLPVRPVLYKEISDNPDTYLTGEPAKMIAAYMAHGN